MNAFTMDRLVALAIVFSAAGYVALRGARRVRAAFAPRPPGGAACGPDCGCAEDRD